MLRINGLMIFDNAAVDVEKKIKLAAAAYQTKTGQAPTVCAVHPMASPPTVEGLTVIMAREVMPNNYFVGVGAA